jgi:hypothetical protein
VWHLAEQVVGHVRVGDVVEQNVQEAVAVRRDDPHGKTRDMAERRAGSAYE